MRTLMARASGSGAATLVPGRATDSGTRWLAAAGGGGGSSAHAAPGRSSAAQKTRVFTALRLSERQVIIARAPRADHGDARRRVDEQGCGAGQDSKGVGLDAD